MRPLSLRRRSLTLSGRLPHRSSSQVQLRKARDGERVQAAEGVQLYGGRDGERGQPVESVQAAEGVQAVRASVPTSAPLRANTGSQDGRADSRAHAQQPLARSTVPQVPLCPVLRAGAVNPPTVRVKLPWTALGRITCFR